MDPTTRASTTEADIAFGWFFSAAIGGSVVAIFFLGADILYGRPLFTPTLLGSVAFLGQDASQVEGVNLVAVSYFTLAHFAAFGVLGLLGTFLFRWAHDRGASPTLTTAVVLFLVMELGWLAASRTLMPGVIAALGVGAVLSANLFTAIAMAFFLQSAFVPKRPGVEESEEDLVEGPGLT